MEKILVTGGAGFIGGAVVRKLVADGKVVINLDKLTYAASPEALAAVAGRNNYRFEKADICDMPAVERILAEHRPDAIMHLAAESHVDRSIDGPQQFIQTNVVGTATLLEAVRAYWQELEDEPRRQFRFHHISTDEVFGSLGATGLFSETTRYQPNSPYSASKAASDHLVRAWGETYGVPVLVTNCSNNYGPYQFPEKLIPLMIIRGMAGEPLPVYGKGDNVRDWLHVEDHARALCLVVERGRPGETYNIGGNAEMTNIEVVRTICRLLDARRPAGRPHERLISYVTDRPGHDRRYAMDIAKIERELGWRPTETFQSGLERTVSWYLENEPWWRPILARGAVERIGLGSKRRAAG